MRVETGRVGLGVVSADTDALPRFAAGLTKKRAVRNDAKSLKTAVRRGRFFKASLGPLLVELDDALFRDDSSDPKLLCIKI